MEVTLTSGIRIQKKMLIWFIRMFTQDNANSYFSQLQ
jgi:hypothetical protein